MLSKNSKGKNPENVEQIVVSGVPRGSVLPRLVLSLIYTADLPRCVGTLEEVFCRLQQIIHYFDIKSLQDSVKNLNSDVQKVCIT